MHDPASRALSFQRAGFPATGQSIEYAARALSFARAVGQNSKLPTVAGGLPLALGHAHQSKRCVVLGSNRHGDCCKDDDKGSSGFGGQACVQLASDTAPNIIKKGGIFG
jgi:hypothetical protein